MRIPRPVVGYTVAALRWISVRWSSADELFYPHTIMTGQWACRTTEAETLPISALRIPPWPRLPMTISPTPSSSAIAHDLLGYPSHPEVGPANGSSGDLYPPDQPPEHLSALLLVLVVERAVVTYGAGSIQEVGHPLDVNDVQLGSSALGEIYGCPSGKLGLLGAVGGHQDLRREDLHFKRLLAAIRPTVMIPLAPQKRRAKTSGGDTQDAEAPSPGIPALVLYLK